MRKSLRNLSIRGRQCQGKSNCRTFEGLKCWQHHAVERLSCSQPAIEVPRPSKQVAKAVKEPEAESQEVGLKEELGVVDNHTPNSTTYAKDRNTQMWNVRTWSIDLLESQLKGQIDQICDLLET